MRGLSLERLNPDDDWPPIFSLHVASQVTAHSLRDMIRGAPSDAKVYVVLDEGGLRPDQLEDIVAPHVQSVSVRIRAQRGSRETAAMDDDGTGRGRLDGGRRKPAQFYR